MGDNFHALQIPRLPALSLNRGLKMAAQVVLLEASREIPSILWISKQPKARLGLAFTGTNRTYKFEPDLTLIPSRQNLTCFIPVCAFGDSISEYHDQVKLHIQERFPNRSMHPSIQSIRPSIHAHLLRHKQHKSIDE